MSDEVEDGALPDSVAELESMTRRELQSAASRAGLPATLDREELVEELTETLELDDE